MKLKDFLKFGGKDLDQAYLEAETPDLEELAGDYKGLLIEGQIPAMGTRFPIRAVNQPWLPWKGKAFFDPSATGGKGKNRFEAGPFKTGVWHFITRVTPSQFGGEPACLVDYDVQENALWMRKAIFDEMKRVDEQLYLGKGGIRAGGANAFTFYWAIEQARF